jgi:hypothetical protein
VEVPRFPGGERFMGEECMDGDWEKVAEEICKESDPERIVALSRELIRLLDKKMARSVPVIEIRKTG